MHKIASNALRLCFKLLLPCPQIGNNAWEWSYGKHDEQEFTGLNIVWVGTILDGIFWIAIIRVEILWVGIFQVELSWVGIFQMGVILGGNFLGGIYPGWELSWWELSGWELSCPRLFFHYSILHKNKNICNFSIAMAWFYQTFLLLTKVHDFINEGEISGICGKFPMLPILTEFSTFIF